VILFQKHVPVVHHRLCPYLIEIYLNKHPGLLCATLPLVLDLVKNWSTFQIVMVLTIFLLQYAILSDGPMLVAISNLDKGTVKYIDTLLNGRVL
jgi:hypothetical protein